MKQSRLSIVPYVLGAGMVAILTFSQGTPAATAHHIQDPYCLPCGHRPTPEIHRAETQYHFVETFGNGYESQLSLEMTYAQDREPSDYFDYDSSNYDDVVAKAKRREGAAMRYNRSQNFGGYGPATGYLKRRGIGGDYSFGSSDEPRRKRHAHAKRRYRHNDVAYPATYDPGLFVQYNKNGGY